jgi:hypothetical protein
MLDLDWNSEFLFEFFSEFGQAVISLVTVDPDQQFTVGPGKSARSGTEDYDPEKKFSDHTLGGNLMP